MRISPATLVRAFLLLTLSPTAVRADMPPLQIEVPLGERTEVPIHLEGHSWDSSLEATVVPLQQNHDFKLLDTSKVPTEGGGIIVNLVIVAPDALFEARVRAQIQLQRLDRKEQGPILEIVARPLRRQQLSSLAVTGAGVVVGGSFAGLLVMALATLLTSHLKGCLLSPEHLAHRLRAVDFDPSTHLHRSRLMTGDIAGRIRASSSWPKRIACFFRIGVFSRRYYCETVEVELQGDQAVKISPTGEVHGQREGRIFFKMGVDGKSQIILTPTSRGVVSGFQLCNNEGRPIERTDSVMRLTSAHLLLPFGQDRRQGWLLSPDGARNQPTSSRRRRGRPR